LLKVSNTRFGTLKDVFGSDESSILADIARLSALYEDLRIELACAAAEKDTLGGADALGHAYRVIYFLRRSLVTWVEFGCALIGVSRAPEFTQLPEDAPARVSVLKALEYFDQHKAVVTPMRNSFGGHLLPEGVNFALREIPAELVGKITWNSKNSPLSLELHYAADLIGGVISSKLQGGSSVQEELKAKLNIVIGAGPVIQEATYSLVLAFVWPRFGR
jgi:hypothetical protein